MESVEHRVTAHCFYQNNVVGIVGPIVLEITFDIIAVDIATQNRRITFDVTFINIAFITCEAAI